jgi:hypothetical protein
MGSCSGCRLHGGESRGKISSVVGSPSRGKPDEQGAATSATIWSVRWRWLHLAKLFDEAIDFGAQFVDEQIVVDVNDRIQRAI